ncbi:TraB/GumN family protein [Vibrio navarrensis]
MKMINKLWVNMLALTLSLPAFSEPLVWRVSNGVTEFRITGSIHVGSQALYPLPKEIEHFLPTSKGLIIEADLTESSEVQYPIPRYTSEQVLDKEQKATLEQIARTLNLPLEQVLLSPPWVSTLTIQIAQIAQLGYQAELGVDNYLIELAKQHQLPLIPLESVQFQINLLANMPQDGKELLISALEQYAEGEQQLSCLIESWSKGDGSNLGKFADVSELSPQLEKVMMTDRNHAWAEQLEQRAQQQPGKYTVVVGTLHLVGKENLLELMEAKGFRVVQLTQSQQAKCAFD